MAYVKKADAIDALKQTAIDAVQYVGHANYSNRERAAMRAIHASVRSGKVEDPEKYDI